MMDNRMWGEWLKQRRRALDLTQDALARQVGCGVTTIRKYERGSRRPSLDIAERLAQALGVPEDEHTAFVQQARGLGPVGPAGPFAADDSAPEIRHNLLTPLTRLVGRAQEVARVRQMLAGEGRLLTLTGPAGIGKTRLSLQVARESLNEFPDGVFFIPLAPIRDPALVTSTIATCLGVTEHAGQSPSAALQLFLEQRRMLLVLDNFEQVLSAGAELAELLTAAPEVKLLVTSRERLHVYGEFEYVVPPLALPPALFNVGQVEQLYDHPSLLEVASVQLFIQRAHAANPDFKLNRANARAVAELCIRLEGLPLAIELAAARSKLYGPRALLARLNKRLDLLSGGARNLPSRQRTLRGAIQWSYELLDPAEQGLFARLAVFRGGCTCEAVEAICNTRRDLRVNVEGGLISLVDKSLLQLRTEQQGEPRFSMLETIREYALEQLNNWSDEAVPTIYDAHFRYYLALAEAAAPKMERLRGDDSGVWVRYLESEHDNVRAALDWGLPTGNQADRVSGLRLAIAMAPFWYVRGRLREGRQWLERGLVGLPQNREIPLRAAALLAVGSMALDQGDLPVARSVLEQALELFQALGDRRGQARTLSELAHTDLRADEKTGLALREQALALYREVGDKAGMAEILGLKGLDAWRSGDLETVHTLAMESLSLSREIGHQYGIAQAMTLLAMWAELTGNSDQARTLLLDSLSIRDAVGDRRQPWLLYRLGHLELAKGQVEQATALFEESLARARDIGQKVAIAWSLRSLGTCACLRAEYVQATALHRESLLLYHALRDTWGIAECLEGLGEVASAWGKQEHDTQRLERAARLLGAAAALRERTHHPRYPAERVRNEQAIAVACDSLGQTLFQAAWMAGRKQTLEDTVAYALHDD